jgi:hypothetical protein
MTHHILDRSLLALMKQTIGTGTTEELQTGRQMHAGTCIIQERKSASRSQSHGKLTWQQSHDSSADCMFVLHDVKDDGSIYLGTNDLSYILLNG